MHAVPPIIVTDLFAPERAALLDLLENLTAAEWAAPTACAGWSVHDVALHIWGGDAGNLSRRRDAHTDATASAGVDFSRQDALLAFLNRFNADWVAATRRISPRVLCDSLRMTGEQIAAYFGGLDQYALGGSVSWAGPERAPVWLDVAREYTERWMHQQHIRDAVGKPGLKERHFFAPVLDAFARALPHTLRHTPAPEGTAVRLIITGEAGGTWFGVRSNECWTLSTATYTPPSSSVAMDQETAWRLFTRGISPEDAAPTITWEGDPVLARTVLDMVSIIA